MGGRAGPDCVVAVVSDTLDLPRPYQLLAIAHACKERARALAQQGRTFAAMRALALEEAALAASRLDSPGRKIALGDARFYKRAMRRGMQ